MWMPLFRCHETSISVLEFLQGSICSRGCGRFDDWFVICLRPKADKDGQEQSRQDLQGRTSHWSENALD
jgi:hypothetical protein